MASHPLKGLSRRPFRGKQLITTLGTLVELPDQAVVLLLGALLERALEREILMRMVRLTRTRRNEMFVGIAPLSSFSAKIKIAYGLAIIGDKGLRELDVIKDIRNQFAHSIHILSFKTPEISNACMSLKTPNQALPEFPAGIGRNLTHNPRNRYLITCFMLWAALGRASPAKKRPRRSRTTWTARFL